MPPVEITKSSPFGSASFEHPSFGQVALLPIHRMLSSKGRFLLSAVCAVTCMDGQRPLEYIVKDGTELAADCLPAMETLDLLRKADETRPFARIAMDRAM